MERIGKDQYYWGIARSVALRGTCLCVVGGAVIVKDDQIVATGYIGAPRKTKDCLELGFCIRREKNVQSGTHYEMCRSVHAEMNAIINAARSGVSLLDGDIFLFFGRKESDGGISPVKAFPCLLCKKMIINAGLKRFIGNDEKENLREYLVSDWVCGWKKAEDITLDQDKYQVKYQTIKSSKK